MPGPLDISMIKDMLLIAAGGYVASQMKEIAKSVTELNIKIALILERVDGHEKRITKIEDREVNNG